MNRAKKKQFITSLKVIIHEYQSAAFAARRAFALVVEPVALWDIELPPRSGPSSYPPPSPILIPPDDVASIQLRLSISENRDHEPPHRISYYVLKFVFISDMGFDAESPFFILWNKDVISEQK